MLRAFGFSIGNMFANSEEEHGESVIKGLPASGGVFEGLVRRVSSRADFDRIQQGDVLVTESTTEAFNILLPLLGAIVTDSGGLLSHAAIVAREYGIPGVVGTRDGTERIPDGAHVRVDGDAGEVTVSS
ncbi:MAG TPA: PEP-utilizing enzyme, partial [Mycobacteriales bacterium]|nr:PEP-utilizing enzyme [Mycobacteriales bacterium]